MIAALFRRAPLTGLVRHGRAIGAGAAVLVALGGIPGARPPRRLEAPVDRVPRERERPNGLVAVRVRAAPDGAPIGGARVRVFGIVDDRAYVEGEGRTDASGAARFAVLARGEAWIVADASGRARASTRLVVDARPRAITLDLGEGHALRATVHDELGAPVAQAEVEAIGSSDPVPVGARTDADGRAALDGLGVGPWHVTARAPGYEDASGRGDHDGDAVALTLRKLGALDVRVAAGDRPAPHAMVFVAGSNLWPPRSTEADAAGFVRVGGLGAGTYALRATLGGEASPIEVAVALARGEEKSLTLQLGPGHFVAVHVVDEANDAVAGARVTLAEGGISPFPVEATTDRHGFARLGPIAHGGATVSAQAEGFVERSAVPVDDPPPAETPVVLLRAGTITGLVVDARGRPIDGATLEIAGTDPNGGPIVDDPRRAGFRAAHFAAMLGGPAPLVAAGELGVVPGPVPAIPIAGVPITAGSIGPASAADVSPWVTRGDGSFRAAPVTPGRIRVIVRHPQYVEAESDLLTLAPGGEAAVDVTMHEGGSLEGRVLDAHDRPVEGARVLVAATRGTLERMTRTASDGTFAFASLPEGVSLSASAPDDEQPSVRMQVAVPDGDHREVTVHLPEARDPITVTVVDDRDDPIDTAQVTATSTSADSLLRSTVFTTASGDAVVKNARGVPLRLEVRAPGHASKIATTDGSPDTVRVALDPAETAAGEVVSARGGDAVAGAEVTLSTDLGTRHARTDAHGLFTLSDLAVGAASIRVRAPGYAPVTESVTVPDSGGRRPFAIDPIAMAAEAVAEGEVVDGQGRPVAGARVARDHVPTWLLAGATPEGIAVTDASGRFHLGGLPEGDVTLEAYAADVGRGRATVQTVSDRTSDRVRIVLAPGEGRARDFGAGGSLAVTLGESNDPPEVVVLSVVEGSEAERGGLLPGDVVRAVDGTPVQSIEDARGRMSGPLSDDVLVEVQRGDKTTALRVGREEVRR